MQERQNEKFGHGHFSPMLLGDTTGPAAAAAAVDASDASAAIASQSPRCWTIEIRRSAKDVRLERFYLQDCMLCAAKQIRRVCTCVVSNNGVRDRNGPSYAKDKRLICGAAVCTDCVVKIAQVNEDSDAVLAAYYYSQTDFD